MKKLILIIIAFLSCSLTTKNALAQNNFYFKDSVLMNDLSKEREMVSKLVKIIDELDENDITMTATNGRQRGIPMNEELLVQFLKCMNVATTHKTPLLIVAVNKKSSKIQKMNLSGELIETSKQMATIGEFINLLKNNQVDFKLKETDNRYKDSERENKFKSEDYIANKKNFVHVEDIISVRYPVLFEDLNLYVDVSWEKNFDPKTKEYIDAKINNIQTTCGTTVLGDYKQQNSLSYHEKGKLIGETNGKFTIYIQFKGQTVPLNFSVKTKTLIDIESGEGKIYAKAYKIEIQ